MATFSLETTTSWTVQVDASTLDTALKAYEEALPTIYAFQLCHRHSKGLLASLPQELVEMIKVQIVQAYKHSRKPNHDLFCVALESEMPQYAHEMWHLKEKDELEQGMALLECPYCSDQSCNFCSAILLDTDAAGTIRDPPYVDALSRLFDRESGRFRFIDDECCVNCTVHDGCISNTLFDVHMLGLFGLKQFIMTDFHPGNWGPEYSFHLIANEATVGGFANVIAWLHKGGSFSFKDKMCIPDEKSVLRRVVRLMRILSINVKSAIKGKEMTMASVKVQMMSLGTFVQDHDY